MTYVMAQTVQEHKMETKDIVKILYKLITFVLKRASFAHLHTNWLILRIPAAFSFAILCLIFTPHNRMQH